MKKFKWHMLITSFYPMWLSIILTFSFDIGKALLKCNKLGWFHYVEMAIFCVIIVNVIISTIFVVEFVKRKTSNQNEKSGIATIIEAKRSNKLLTDFLLSYILPMIAFDFASPLGMALFIIYFIILAILSIRNNNVYTNILMEIMRFKIYLCTLQYKVGTEIVKLSDCLVLSKLKLPAKVNQEIYYFDFDKDIFLALKEKGDEDHE